MLAGVAVALVAPATAWAIGELTQKPGRAGCVADGGAGGRCQVASGLDVALGVAASADGRHVYAASYGSKAVTIFGRDASGGLTQSGCVTNAGIGDCTPATSLPAPTVIALSPDGRSAYAASSDKNTIAVLDRDAATGALGERAAPEGCVTDAAAVGCVDARVLDAPTGVTVSPDGRNVYVASEGSDAVDVLIRNTVTGALAQPLGATGCVSDTGAVDGCANGLALANPEDVAVSPDGASVYVTARISNAVAVFDRGQANGGLTQKAGAAGCVSSTVVGCQPASALATAHAVAVAPDGRNVYVGFADGVAIFDRGPTGELTQKAGTAGCVTETGNGGACQDATALADARDLTVSPDGTALYVVSASAEGVAVLDRDPATGALAQKPGTAGCISDSGSGGACRDGQSLAGARGVAVSPDGANAYVTAPVSDAIAIFDRAGPTGPLPTVGSADTTAPVISAFSLSNKRFRVGPGRTAIAAAQRARRGTKLRFTLSERADVSISIQRRLPGRRVGSRCRKPTRKLRGRRHCIRYGSARVLTRRDRDAGRNSISFSGRIGRKALARGSYRVTVVATDDAGNRSKARRALFSLVRR
jgi:DNA-binding beta-propeller fold protein YncE